MIRVLFAILPLAAGAGSVSQSAPLRQDAYVWQRAWTDSVTNAVATLAPHFGELIALQAQVSWDQATPTLTKVGLDYSALRATGRPVGLALRVGPFSGPFPTGDPRIEYLVTLSQSLVAEAVANQLQPTEFQLDVDCPDSRLGGYRVWLEAIQKALHPLPVTITALPSWLNQAAFTELVSVADGYVLQVHSFERPRSRETALTLCDPQAARRAVARAAAIGRPFRVALPTYGYLAAFDLEGRFLGLSAEGPARNWPDTAHVVELRADERELSRLMREWGDLRPPELLGVIWYRLPVAGDELNWAWPTLESVMAGDEPEARVCVHVRRVKPGLVEIDLANEGTADSSDRLSATVRWNDSRKIAADGIHGYQMVESMSGVLRFQPLHAGGSLRTGERITIGWIRFDRDPEVKAELHALPD